VVLHFLTSPFREKALTGLRLRRLQAVFKARSGIKPNLHHYLSQFALPVAPRPAGEG
jgi:hypothetical protein